MRLWGYGVMKDVRTVFRTKLMKPSIRITVADS